MKLLKLLILTLFAISMTNCAKKVEKKSREKPSDPPPITEPLPGQEDYVPPERDSQGAFRYGGTTTFVPVNDSVFSEYTGRPMDDFDNVLINVNLVKYQDNTYGGSVTIDYDEYGQPTDTPGFFETGGSKKAVQYNQWLNSKKTRFHAVLQDLEGGLVISIENIIHEDFGDRGGKERSLGSGRIWFKNFVLKSGSAPHPPTYCWFVSLGPYDCRPWPSGKGMKSPGSVTPSGGGYKLLGRFSNLDISETFNNQL